MENNKLTIRATILANVQKVWDYYTMPEHIVNWNFAIDSWHCPSATNNLSVGGKFTSRMEAKDGSFGFDFEGIYEEVIQHKKLSYAMADGRKASIEFIPGPDKTEIIIHFDAEQENPVDMQRDGWQAILNNFKQYVEKN